MSTPTRPRRTTGILITCEHATARIPAAIATELGIEPARLRTHAAFDLGAAALARALARRLDAPLVLGRVGRLAVDLNRTPGNPGMWSDAARELPADVRAGLLARWHRPHWDEVRALVDQGVRRYGRVLHLAVHSFTPVLRNMVRTMDVGLLYDPSRTGERRFADAWAHALVEAEPRLKVRRNAPYRGVSDGLTRALRRQYPAPRYRGLELELNQRWVAHGRFAPWLQQAVLDSAATVTRSR